MLAAVFCTTIKDKTMLQIKDVRIGNLFDWDVNETCVVEGIIGYQLTKDTLHLKGNRFEKPFIVNAAIGDVSPIKLNIYWFNKFGFELLVTHYVLYSEDGTSSITLTESADGYYYPSFTQMPELSSQSEQIVFLKRIEFVHELQNLVYSLIGQELSVVANGS